MDIERAGSKEKLYITLKGRLDTVTAPKLETVIKNATEQVKILIFDFKMLEYLSSAGLRVLLAAQKMMNKQGEMIIKNVNETIMEVFEITGFSDILTIETKTEEKSEFFDEAVKGKLGKSLVKAAEKEVFEKESSGEKENPDKKIKKEEINTEGSLQMKVPKQIDGTTVIGQSGEELYGQDKLEPGDGNTGQAVMQGNSMPVLERTVKKINKMDDTVVLHINHCMDNSFYFNDILKCVFKEVIFVAVPYNNRDVYGGLDYSCYHAVREGDIYILKKNQEALIERKVDFQQAVRDMIELAFEKELLSFAEQGFKIIIMEDGGYHYKIINRMIERYPFLEKAVIGAVEQTTGGTVKSMQGERRYPVLSVARSYYKIRVEAYFIAKRIIDELRKMLHANGEFMEFHKVLLLGYGIIGRMIALLLRRQDAEVVVYDTDIMVRRSAALEGFTVYSSVKGINFSECLLVIGATGNAAFTIEMLDMFLSGRGEKLYLASASSKQVEFMNIFENLMEIGKEQVPYGEKYLFSDKKELTLLANGSPVNFYEKQMDSLTFSVIDPVFAEMLFLASYLYLKGNKMERKTTLLSSDREIDEAAEEMAIITLWKKLNGITSAFEIKNIHPCEEKLKKMILCREEESGHDV